MDNGAVISSESAFPAALIAGQNGSTKSVSSSEAEMEI